jgi:hypothetical protein
MFFSQPRDIVQQLAASELERRDWRWHKILRQWLHRDTPPNDQFNTSTSLQVLDLAPRIPVGTAPQPIPNSTQERGVYVFFDAQNWRRVRREFVLDFAEIDHGDTSAAGLMGLDGASNCFGAGALGSSQQQVARAWGMSGGVNGTAGMGFGGAVQSPVAANATGLGGMASVGAFGGNGISSATAAQQGQGGASGAAGTGN